MRRALLVSLRFHDGRYHGAGDWPPSPARLFQALVAAAARGGAIPPEYETALRHLESLPPPMVAAPAMRLGQAFTTYVPNNDLDAVGGDSSRIDEIRTPKQIRPRLFDNGVPLLYCWAAEGIAGELVALPAIAARLYQVGRGQDMAFATAELLDAADADARLVAHPGPVFRPSVQGKGGIMLACPVPGSLSSLTARHAAQSLRFRAAAKPGQALFVQPPKARLGQIGYDCPPARYVFALRAGTDFRPWPLARVVEFVEAVRDGAAARLRQGGVDEARIERVVIGRGAGPADIATRPRLVPLPSIGSAHADQAIRRILLEVPPDCPIPAEDLAWALSGLPLGPDDAPDAPRLVPADDVDRMVDHYQPAAGARLWRSITPVALPVRHGTVEKTTSDAAAALALSQALRHAGIRVQPENIRLQREPFTARGARAEAFARAPRFPVARLTHAELRFSERVPGPLILGDGRWLGLGLFRPVEETLDVLAFAVQDGLVQPAPPTILARALRRAVMARVQQRIGQVALPSFFSGHAPDGAPLRDGNHRHLAFAFDPLGARLLVVAPHRLERRMPSAEERRHLAVLDEAMQGMTELRAGPAGLLRLQAASFDPSDRLLGQGRAWESVTDYLPTRHAKRSAPDQALSDDARTECRRRGWPEPHVEVLAVREGPRGGLAARLRLHFAVACDGPLLLGRGAHLGGGLFARPS